MLLKPSQRPQLPVGLCAFFQPSFLPCFRVVLSHPGLGWAGPLALVLRP